MLWQPSSFLQLSCALICVCCSAGTAVAWQAPTPVAAALSPANRAATEKIDAYLNCDYENRILSVEVDAKQITITGHVEHAAADLYLQDIPLPTTTGQFDASIKGTPLEIEDNKFTIQLPRFVNGHDRRRDRLLSRWQIFTKMDGGKTDGILRPASNARYAEDIQCNNPDLRPANPTSKKGLGGWNPRRAPALKNELAELGIASVTVNLFPLHAFVSPKKRPGYTPFQWQGRRYFANEAKLAQADNTFRAAAAEGAMVSAILLAANAPNREDADQRLLNHPDTQAEARYAIPNMTSSASVDYYGAIINFMAQRWSRPDGKYGRVHHWIIHNEVDFGWEWANAGVKSDVEYMDLYHRSMRLVDLIVRQHDANARTWISLTHHWADRGHRRGYGSRRMLELLNDFCAVEGDFPWGVAFHPYPQSLFNPRTWEDDQATFDFDTPKITPRNIEVLDAYMAQPKMRYRQNIRPVQLSENGFNSPDYTPQSLQDQAAGMAMAWKKIENLPSIVAWQYHNWIDNRAEGNLRIGLRRFKDASQQPLGKKPIWELYKALATDSEDEAAAPYLKTIGVNSWDEVKFLGRIK